MDDGEEIEEHWDIRNPSPYGMKVGWGRQSCGKTAAGIKVNLGRVLRVSGVTLDQIWQEVERGSREVPERIIEPLVYTNSISYLFAFHV